MHDVFAGGWAEMICKYLKRSTDPKHIITWALPLFEPCPQLGLYHTSVINMLLPLAIDIIFFFFFFDIRGSLDDIMLL